MIIHWLRQESVSAQRYKQLNKWKEIKAFSYSRMSTSNGRMKFCDHRLATPIAIVTLANKQMLKLVCKRLMRNTKRMLSWSTSPENTY